MFAVIGLGLRLSWNTLEAVYVGRESEYQIPLTIVLIITAAIIATAHVVFYLVLYRRF